VVLTNLPPSVSQLSKQYGILNISQPYRPPRPVKGTALHLLTKVCLAKLDFTVFGSDLRFLSLFDYVLISTHQKGSEHQVSGCPSAVT
jgi:hypothetical protein